MKNSLDNVEEILNCHISGFHQYVLQKPVHLAFVSQNFCEITGYRQEELLSDSIDLYKSLIHPADSRVYSDFLQKLARKEQTVTVQYRIICKDKKVKYVTDTATSKCREDGILVAYSVLTDITSVSKENRELQFFKETIPCGFVRYTCEKQPKVTYVNEQMLKILGFSKENEGEADDQEFYRDNIYLMIPMEERRRFSCFLQQVYKKGVPVAGEVTVLRRDGTKAHLYGWVTKCVNEQGEEEFQSVCMDVTEKYRTSKANKTEQYLNALTEVYDKIFEYNFSNKTVKYIHGKKSSTFGRIQNIPMHMEEATKQWMENTVVKEDREKVRNFFFNIFKHNFGEDDKRPPQIHFQARSADERILDYMGIFLKVDRSVSLFCLRSISDRKETEALRDENAFLKNINKNMQELVMRFSDGIVAFELKNDQVKPLYASDNVCNFFGYTKEEWVLMMEESHSIKKFVSQSGVAYEDFEELLEAGEADFTYVDTKTGAFHRVKAICSQKCSDDSSTRYVMLYSLNDKIQLSETEAEGARIYIRTFGYFDVFVDEKPIAFRNKKSKELFALLVDRRGGFISSEEAISFLWEDETVNNVTLARYRKVALRLKNILEEYGIADVVESIDGKRRIVTEKVRCDLYDYLSQKEEYVQLFKGSYLTNYSWGEMTLGELLHE